MKCETIFSALFQRKRWIPDHHFMRSCNIVSDMASDHLICLLPKKVAHKVSAELKFLLNYNAAKNNHDFIF